MQYCSGFAREHLLSRFNVIDPSGLSIRAEAAQIPTVPSFPLRSSNKISILRHGYRSGLAYSFRLLPSFLYLVPLQDSSESPYRLSQSYIFCERKYSQRQICTAVFRVEILNQHLAVLFRTNTWHSHFESTPGTPMLNQHLAIPLRLITWHFHFESTPGTFNSIQHLEIPSGSSPEILVSLQHLALPFRINTWQSHRAEPKISLS